jgi:hypothetical protein
LRFTAKRKNLEIFQMSQKNCRSILHCLVASEVFFKKHSFSSQEFLHSTAAPAREE